MVSPGANATMVDNRKTYGAKISSFIYISKQRKSQFHKRNPFTSIYLFVKWRSKIPIRRECCGHCSIACRRQKTMERSQNRRRPTVHRLRKGLTTKISCAFAVKLTKNFLPFHDYSDRLDEQVTCMRYIFPRFVFYNYNYGPNYW